MKNQVENFQFSIDRPQFSKSFLKNRVPPLPNSNNCLVEHIVDFGKFLIFLCENFQILNLSFFGSVALGHLAGATSGHTI